MFAYQKNQRFFAQVADGLEEAGGRELEALGAEEVKASYRGIYFTADHRALYRINYSSSICTRILAPLLTFDCHSDKYLYNTAGSIPWSAILSLETTFAIFANVSNSNITHSQYAARKLKDAIVDQFRESCGKRPDVDPDNPDVWISLYIQGNKATISLDTSGGSLHRRGYRKASVKAPMQETVAAAIIKFSQWDGSKPLYRSLLRLRDPVTPKHCCSIAVSRLDTCGTVSGLNTCLILTFNYGRKSGLNATRGSCLLRKG